MTESIYELFSPGGAIGGFLAPFSGFDTSEQSIIKAANACFLRAAKDKAVFRPCEIDRFAFYRRKRCYFRPGDVILRAGYISDPKRLGGLTDRCVTTLAALYDSSPSFCLDIASAGGGTVADIALCDYFVVPEYSLARTLKKLVWCAEDVRECGVVTCDGEITFLKNGEKYISSPRGETEELIKPNRPRIELDNGFTDGCLYAFSYALKLISRDRFPAEPPYKPGIKNFASFALGEAAYGLREYRTAKRYDGVTPSTLTLTAVPLRFSKNYPVTSLHAVLESFDYAASYSKYYALRLVDADGETLKDIPGVTRTVNAELFSSGPAVAVLTE